MKILSRKQTVDVHTLTNGDELTITNTKRYLFGIRIVHIREEMLVYKSLSRTIINL